MGEPDFTLLSAAPEGGDLPTRCFKRVGRVPKRCHCSSSTPPRCFRECALPFPQRETLSLFYLGDLSVDDLVELA